MLFTQKRRPVGVKRTLSSSTFSIVKSTLDLSKHLLTIILILRMGVISAGRSRAIISAD